MAHPKPQRVLSSNGSSHGEKSPISGGTGDSTKYPPTSKVIFIIIGLYLCAFLVAVDRLIIATAIPSITDDFDSLGDVGWYGSAYLLTACSFMFVMSKCYTVFNPKWTFLTTLVIFEIGSVVCGSASNSTILIIGRAIAGFGVAGLQQGSIIIVVYLVPLAKRPVYQGIGGMIFAIASAIGPLLGGALTDGPGWRWCFYVNLPCGAFAFVVILLMLQIPENALPPRPDTMKEKAARFDPVGTLCFLPSIVCLILALQWGGVTYSWSDGRVIALLVVFVVLFTAFLVVQKWKRATATIPGHIFAHRAIMAGTWFAFFNGGGLQAIFYFLPIWFQAIKGASAIHSGVMNLPAVLGLVVSSLSSGILTKKLGYFTPWMILSSSLTPISAGLISTFMPHTAHPAWIGYQAMLGLGIGMGNQQPSVAAQTTLQKRDVPVGAALVSFAQFLGGAVFISAGNNIFDSSLTKQLSNIHGLDVGPVAMAGATELRHTVPSRLLSQVLVAYNHALTRTFYLATALFCVTILGAVAMPWVSVKKGPNQQKRPHPDTEIEKSSSADPVGP